jgi:hypothetical protein
MSNFLITTILVVVGFYSLAFLFALWQVIFIADAHSERDEIEGKYIW